MNCYRIEEVQEGEPLFQHVDATYVLHLENNGRIDRIKKELRQYYPSKNTFVLFNKGYRKCPKNLPAPETRFDIVDANLYIFRDAKEKGFKNILVLEDDFFFDSKIQDHCLNVDHFISTHQDFIYYLGNVPAIIFPYSWYHYRATFTMASHAVIYSESYRNALLRVPQESILDWDIFQLTFKNSLRFMYYTPLCYQLFPETENSNGWGNENVVIRMIAIVVFQWFQLLKMNVQSSPGYPFFYFLSKVIFWIVLAVILVCCVDMKNIGVGSIYKNFYSGKYGSKKRR